MASLSTSISLALATKLRLLFETSTDKFLSFPVGLAYPTSFFAFMETNGQQSAIDQYNHKVEFARMTNMLPKDRLLFAPDANAWLWDIYAQSLTNSLFAQSSLTPAQNTQLDAAIDFLTDKQTVDGIELLVPSAAVQRFYQYKTVYDDLNRQYIDEKLTVDFADNSEEGRRLREAWVSVKERTWLDLIRKAEEDWINLGLRDTVRSYQSIRADLEPKRFPHQFKTACQNDLELGELPDPSATGLIGGYATFFSPSNVFQPTTPWLSLTLSKAEMMSLAAQAPAELSARFGNGQADDTIERISFEYNRAVLVRPWLNTSFFTARSWKLPADAVLSDGKTPRSGLLPAYTSGLVVVRNIRVTRRVTGTAPPPLVIPLLSKMQMNQFLVSRQSPPIIAKPRPEVMMQAGSVQARLARLQKLQDAHQPDDGAQDTVTNLAQWHRQQANLQQAAFLQSTIRVSANTRVQVPVSKIPPVVVGPRPRPLPQVQTVEEKFDFDGIVIIAFECTRLPKSPNPDDSLPWT